MNLAGHFLKQKVFFEHHSYYERDFSLLPDEIPTSARSILFKNKPDSFCFAIKQNGQVENSYYIGTDWITDGTAAYVQPKVNRNSTAQVDYMKMLFDALKHPEVLEHTTDLFEIKWDKPEIQINQQQDMLTPLLVVQYLQVVKNLVRKGLKKSYYKVEQNLRSRVKGKVLVAQNIKQNLVKAKTLNTICSFDEFGFNGIENRILKKALIFVQRFLPTLKLGSDAFFQQTFNYINPAFQQVSEEASIRECQHIKINPFYKEYKLAIELALQILRRFGYNIQNTAVLQISTPPFWIDMSKLFELYVLGLLKDAYGGSGKVIYHNTSRGNEIDFLVDTGTKKFVIDAKYKLKYGNGGVNHEDIRQVSGYARLKHIFPLLGIATQNETHFPVIDCMIIYPDNSKVEKFSLDTYEEIPEYVAMFKKGVKLPSTDKKTEN